MSKEPESSQAEPAFSEEALTKLWQEKYDYRVNILKVSPEKAKEWTDRTINDLRKSNQHVE